MHIDDALARFQTQLDADGRSRHTRDQYDRHVRALARWLAPEDRIERIDHEVLARFLASPVARTRSDGKQKRATSTNCLRSSLRGFFGYCSAAGLTRSDPSRLIRRARCGTAPPRTLSEEDQRRLLDTLRREDGGRDHALIHTLLATGMRISSALGLHAEDLDLIRGEAQVRTAKGNRPATVILGREIREHLQVHLAGRNSGPVFEGSAGVAMTSRQAARRLRHWASRAGIQSAVSCHVLRHCHGMAVYRKTGDLLLTQMALGHASIVSTTIYARADRERLRAVLGA